MCGCGRSSPVNGPSFCVLYRTGCWKLAFPDAFLYQAIINTTEI